MQYLGKLFYINATLKEANTINVSLQIIVVIALTLSGSNLYGYVRCKLGKSDSISQSFKNMAAGLVQKQMVSNVSNALV